MWVDTCIKYCTEKYYLVQQDTPIKNWGFFKLLKSLGWLTWFKGRYMLNNFANWEPNCLMLDWAYVTESVSHVRFLPDRSLCILSGPSLHLLSAVIRKQRLFSSCSKWDNKTCLCFLSQNHINISKFGTQKWKGVTANACDLFEHCNTQMLFNLWNKYPRMFIKLFCHLMNLKWKGSGPSSLLAWITCSENKKCCRPQTHKRSFNNRPCKNLPYCKSGKSQFSAW